MIRAVAPGDVAAITAIYAAEVATGTASFEITPPDVAEMHRRFAALAEGGFPALALIDGGRLLGYAYAGPYHPREAYRSTLEDSIYVATDARGRGIGARLLDALVAAGRERGYRQMVALIGDSGNAASVALHARAGFRSVGTLEDVGLKFGRWLDVVLMQRAL